MKLIVIPPWLKQRLVNQQISLNQLNDLDKLSTTTSLHDLGFYIFINSEPNLSLFLDPSIIETFTYSLSLDTIKCEKTKHELISIIDAYNIEYNAIDFQKWFKLMFEESYTNQQLQIEIVSYDRDYIVIMPYINHYENENHHYMNEDEVTRINKPLHYQLLEIMHQFFKIEDLASLPLFRYSITH